MDHPEGRTGLVRSVHRKVAEVFKLGQGPAKFSGLHLDSHEDKAQGCVA